MKIVLVIMLLSLCGCSSLITRGELSSCQKQCSDSQHKIEKITKKDGKVDCQCSAEVSCHQE